MRQINSREFAARVDDRIAAATYNMLQKLMTDCEREGFVRDLSPMEEYAIEYDTEDAANRLKETVYAELVSLGLDVEPDGRDF